MTTHGNLGPYLNDDGDWWVPATVPYTQARDIVVGCLSYSIPEDGTLVYKGKVMTGLCTEAHEDPAECDQTCYFRTLAYHWEENRKW
jgi:hypothetical protein